MDHLERLWIELIQETEESIPESVYNDIIHAGHSHRLWNSTSDETLRSVISFINSKLNNPKTREYGLITLTKFINQVDPGRYVGIHEGLTSALHLSLKSLHIDITHQFLNNILPHCRKVPELNQVVTNSVIPKILSWFCDSNRSNPPSKSELILLITCIQKYHGPCGNQRQNLERTILGYIDKNNEGLGLDLLCEILPLISTAGGGGATGLKHSEDWKEMITKTMASIHYTLSTLLNDACPMIDSESPYDETTPKLSLSGCTERDVFPRITFLKNRLLKLAKILQHYLNDEFPSPKPVPMKGILSLVRNFLILDPLSILRSYATPPREFIYISTVIPSLRESAYAILQSLINCVGSNILTEGSQFEELTMKELKWMSERPNAFTELRCIVYETILCYLEATGSQVSNPKTSISWINHLILEINIKKKTAEINLNFKRSGKKKGGKDGVGGKINFVSSTVLGSSSAENIIESNSSVANLALKIIGIILPNLDPSSHKTVSVTVGRTAAEVLQSEIYPSPYEDPICRKSLFELVLSLITNPVQNSPISLGFFTKLLQESGIDSTSLTKFHSYVERIIHPISPSLFFTPLAPIPPSTSAVDSENEEMDESEEVVETMENYSQTEEEEVKELDKDLSFHKVDLESSIREAIESTMEKILQRKSKKRSFEEMYSSDDEDDLHSQENFHTPKILSPNSNIENNVGGTGQTQTQNGGLENIPSYPIINGSTTKKGIDIEPILKDGEMNYEDMITDFVPY